MFDAIRTRILQIKAAPLRTAEIAAPRIADRLRADSTTERGNVPSYGKFGDVPSAVTASADGDGASITVTGADWVIRAAEKRGQVDAWAGIAADAAAEAMAPR